MFILSFTLFFINIILKYIIKLLLWDTILSKLFLILLFGIILFQTYYYPIKKRKRLSYIRELKLYFPYAYVFKSNKDQIKSIMILLIYISIFIFGIFALRILGRNRTIDLTLYYDNISCIVKQCTALEILLNIVLIIFIILLYYQGIRYILERVKFHRVRLHLYSVQFKYYIYFHQAYNKYITLFFYNALDNKIAYALYYLRLKNISVTSGVLDYDIIRKENTFSFEKMIRIYLICKQTKIHYHILCLIFISELYYNDLVIHYTYKILPIIFLYDLWVKFTNIINLKNITYDIALHHIVHQPLIAIDKNFLTFGKDDYLRVYEKEYLKEIVSKYVRNKFLDKDVQDQMKKMEREFTSTFSDFIEKNYYVAYIFVFLLLRFIL